MDPETTLVEALEAMRAGNRYLAADKLSDLSDWLNRGGYIPHALVDAIGEADAAALAIILNRRD